MPANNFEDDVRKKMEELRFVPSRGVWDNVEEKIRADRKRRRLLFWLPLTGILAGSLIWFAWPQQNGQQLSQHQMQQPDRAHSVPAAAASTPPKDGEQGALSQRAAETSSVQPTSPVTGTAPATPGASNSAPASTTSAAPATPAASTNAIPSTTSAAQAENAPSTNSIASGTAAPVAPGIPENTKEKKSVKTGQTQTVTSEAEYLASVSRAAENKGSQARLKKTNAYNGSGAENKSNAKRRRSREDLVTAAQRPDINEEPAEKVNDLQPAKTRDGSTDTKDGSALTSNARPANAFVGKSAPEDDAAKKQPAKAGEIPAAKSQPDSALAKTPKKSALPVPSKKSRMEWGFTLAGGATRQLEQNDVPPAVLNRAIASNIIYVLNESKTKAGPSFSAGFTVARQVGKTWRLQTGIQYSFFSSRIPNSGQRIVNTAASFSPASNRFLLDYSAAAYGSNPVKRNYSNRYQFIQIPVTVEKQFGVRSPVSVQAGLSAGYLTNVHALIYEPLLDQYLEDNSEFNKVQFSGLLAVYWKFKLDDHWSVRAGPELQYQFTDLMKTGVPLNDHLLTGGIRIILMHSAR